MLPTRTTASAGDHARSWKVITLPLLSASGGDHAMEQGSTKTDANSTALFAGEAWFDPIEAGIRERVH